MEKDNLGIWALYAKYTILRFRRMKEIIIVFTRHKEVGAFRSSVLLEILNLLRPEIIFLEASHDDYECQFVKNVYESLESKSLKSFKKRSNIDLIPTGVSYSKDFLLKTMSDQQRFSRAVDIHSTEYFRFKYTEMESKENLEGFAYVNSKQYGEDQKELNVEEEKIIERIGDSELVKLYKQWNALQREREERMLAEINRYSLDTSFKKAVFLIGAAHRNSIVNQVQELGEENIKWRFFNSNACQLVTPT